MLNFLLGNLVWIVGGIAAIAGAFFIRKSGKTAEKADHLEKQLDREKRGRDAVSKEQAETTGSDNRTLVDRMRRRHRGGRRL